jgi:signal peptidase I
MPGSAVCGRCGTSLGLATAVMDVHPPRAGRFAKSLRRRRPPPRIYRAAREATMESARGASQTFEKFAPRFPPLPVTLRLIVPGWAHFYLGQRSRGHLYLWSYLSCLLPGLFMLGTVWGSIQIGLAFSVHTSAAIEIATRELGPGEMRDRFVRGLGVAAMLVMLIYWPAGRLLLSVAEPSLIQHATPPALLADDVLLVTHWTSPQIGQVVLYTLPEYRTAIVQHRRYEFYGDRIDRILAGPGDKVRYRDGRLWVNDKASTWFPLNPLHIEKSEPITVPAGNYFILPSTAVGPNGAAMLNLWEAIGIIPAANIHGRVYLRTHPLSRFGRVG